MRTYLKLKDNETIRNDMERDVQDILNSNYKDLGGGDLRFLPYDALVGIASWAETEMEKYEED